MTRRRTAAVLTGLAVAAGPAATAWPRHRVKPCPLPGIPAMPYRTVDAAPKPTLTAVSLVRVPATPAPSAVPLMTTDAALQVFQLRETRLQIDHCFLSRVAVTLHPDGRYQVSFRADQNPMPGDRDVRSPLRPGEVVNVPLQTTQFRRNLFIVKVRGYGVFPTLGDRPSLAPGQPVLVELPVEPFWVQRGEPYAGLAEGHSDAVRQFLPLLDRVEVEFTYR